MICEKKRAIDRTAAIKGRGPEWCDKWNDDIHHYGFSMLELDEDEDTSIRSQSDVTSVDMLLNKGRML